MRVAGLAHDAEALARIQGLQRAEEVLRRRSGRVYDPVLVAVLLPIVADALTQVDKLDPRDVGLAVQGLTIGQIGRRLGISAKTVDTHIQHIYAKTGVSTRDALAGNRRAGSAEPERAPAPADHGAGTGLQRRLVHAQFRGTRSEPPPPVPAAQFRAACASSCLSVTVCIRWSRKVIKTARRCYTACGGVIRSRSDGATTGVVATQFDCWQQDRR